MKKGKKAKDYWTHDDLVEMCRGKSETEVAALTAQFWAMHGIDPEKDFYSPEETKKRMDTMVRACLFIPAADEEEQKLREQIAEDMDKGRYAR